MANAALQPVIARAGSALERGQAATTIELLAPLLRTPSSLTKDDVKPGAREEQLVAGDRFVLCTDGIHGKLDSASLATVLAGTSSATEGADKLVNEAITRGTSDNATALVINVS